jgi:hypothetical protein
MSDQSYLDDLRDAVGAAEYDLWNEVENLCPKPHRAVQHRDGMQPWCNRCGRTDRGALIKEVKTDG